MSICFSKTDEVGSIFRIIGIYAALDGSADSKADFDNSWQKIVQGPLGAGSAAMGPSNTENG